MWIYVSNNLILGTNPNDMTGNTGWVEYDGEIAEPLFDEYDVAMYAYENGVIRERTEEEREAERPVPQPPQPTVTELEAMLNALIRGDTE